MDENLKSCNELIDEKLKSCDNSINENTNSKTDLICDVSQIIY